MTWRNLGFQPHPWRAAVKAGEGKTSTWGLGSTAGPRPTEVYAGRLRLVLECECTEGADAGWQDAPQPAVGQRPSAQDTLLLPFYPASRLGVQNPSREASALEGRLCMVGLDRLETREVGRSWLGLPALPPQSAPTAPVLHNVLAV